MKGHIREHRGKRGKVWHVVIDIGKDPGTGKRRQHWETIRTSKRDAQTRLRELLTSLDVGTFVKPSRLTVAQWLEEWLHAYAEQKCSPKTIDSYRGIVRIHIVPEIGAIGLKELEPRHLEALYASKKGKVSVRTIRYIHTLMWQALDYAVKKGVLSKNAAALAEPPARDKKEMNVIEPQDIDRFLQVAHKTPYGVMFETLLFSGLRRGEMLALRWKDVDLAHNRAFVSRTMYKLRGKVIVGPPKTQASQRLIALPDRLVDLLERHRQIQLDQCELLGRSLKDDDLVFAHSDGTPFDPSVVSHGFGHVATKAGLKDIRLHDLRHSCATLLLKSHIHPLIVAAQLGHASVRTTLDTYSKILPGLQEEAMKSLDAYKPKQLSQKNQGDV